MGEPLSDADGALRTELTSELARLKRASPLEVLGLLPTAEASEVRPAFLAATKKHHPNRFARHDASIVRLANEIFLLVRAAYEKASAPRAPGESKSVDLKGPVAVAAPAPTAATGKAPSVRDLKPIAAGEPTRASRPTAPPPSRETTPPKREAGSSSPPPAGGRADDGLRAAMAEQRRKRIASAVGSSSNLPSPSPRGTPSTPSATAAASAATTAAAAGAARQRSGSAPRSLSRDDRMRDSLQKLDAGQLSEARAGFRALLADRPDDVRVRALLHLAAARELIAAGKPSEARAELERSIAADPSLVEAKDQLAALDKKEGGLLSRWFRK